MKKTEIIFGIIAIIGIGLKFLEIPLMGFINSLILSSFAMFYYFFGFALFNDIKWKDIFNKKAYNNTNIKKIIGAIGLGFILSIIITGILFKIQSWPGVSVILITGIIFLTLVLLVALILYLRNKSKYYIQILKRSLIYLFIAIIFYLIPLSLLLKQ